MLLCNKYIFRIHFKSTICVVLIFIALFALVDSMASNSRGFFISFLTSIANLDTLFAFIALISTIVVLLKIKRSSEDVALVSIGESPESVFKMFTLSAVCCYFILAFVLHPVAFEVLKHNDRVYSGKNCIFESTGISNENDKISISSTKYNMCQDVGVLNQIDFEKNILKDSPIDVKIYESRNDQNIEILHNTSNNKISNVKFNIKTKDELEVIRKIDQYKEDLQRGQISIYHIIYLAFFDHTGIVGKGEIVDVILYKGRNTMLVVLFVNFCYFIMMANKRSRRVGSIVVKTLIFSMIYYVVNYIFCEKLIYSDSFLMKIFGFFFFNLLIYFVLRHIQYVAFLNFSDFIKDLRKSFKIV